jgi:6-phosphofructokinase
MLKGNMLIAHGGGPTPVINSSLRGAVEEALRHNEIENIYGARFGAEGILKGDIIELGAWSKEQLELLSHTPASAIGSCRRKLTEEDFPSVFDCFERYNIRYFFYNGGNDSMDTCNKIYQMAKQRSYDLRIIGIPKTIDNDLALIDHSPGFGSSARYYAVSALELAMDAAALPIHVVIMEVMGRNAGWLTAASALFADKMPCEILTYLPEVPFDNKKFLKDVREKYSKGRGLLVTISEGIRYADGRMIADSGIVDGFGHTVPGGAAQTLSDMIMKHTPLKSRSEKPGLLGRVSMANVSDVDRDEAYGVGKHAVFAAVSGKSGYMVGIKCSRSGGYSSDYELIPLDQVANVEKKFPLEWTNSEGNGIGQEFIDYCMPLIGTAAPEFFVLDD